MTPLIQQAVRLTPEPESALWFDVGVLQVPYQTTVSPEILMHLPFSRTGVAGIDTEGKKFSLWLTGGDNKVIVGGCTMDAPVQYKRPFVYVLTDEGLRHYDYETAKEIRHESILPVLRIVAAALLKLSEASTGYRPTAQPTFINLKRKRKGKTALTFDWTTVEIKPPAPKNVPQGGTHASPRMHDRRGHWRTLKTTGKRVWVRDCKVGDASLGAVFHDYRVSAGPQHAAPGH